MGLASNSSAQTLAFPGALGVGQLATGGRGGIVYHVTTLADSGTGSFRDAVSHSGRIVVFDVGGYISLASPVTCANNLTIAGQTAPGGGIGIMGHEVSFSAKFNEIVRHVRFRPDSSANGEDGINVGDGTNMIFDHVSIEFGPYNNIDAHGNNGSDAITVQNSIIADPSYNGSSSKQGFGAHTEHLGGKMAWYYNLWVSEHNRQPLAKIDTIFVNNVEYNFQAGYTVADTSGNFRHDIINNYFITGPTDPSGGDAFFQMNANQSIYSTGNLIDSGNDGALNGGPIDPGGGGPVLTSPWSTLSTNATVFSTATAYHYDVSSAGAFPRDQVDSLVLSQVQTLGNGTAGTGAGTAGPSSLYNNQTQTGLANNGYGVINGGIAAIDTDGDGMPDYWEKAMGLNPNSSSDGMTVGTDGYANIEHYLNWLADLHAMTATNAPVDVDLWQLTIGFTNASTVYAVNNASNGVVSLNSAHIAHFVPSVNFMGMGSFQFSVSASDGSKYTNTVNVLVTPITTPLNLVWQGDGTANVWTNTGPANWSDGTNLVAFASGDNVTFDDNGSNTPAINLGGPVTAGTVYVIADSQDYTFGGSGYLAGGTILFKTGNGQLNLYTPNTFSGGVTINDGTVQVGDGVSLNGGLGGPVVNNSALVFATATTVSCSASISGGGTVTETGPGIVTLSGTQTYNGPTAITAGGMTFSGSVPPSDITNNGTLTLASTGSANYTNVLSGPGNVVVNASGVLALSGSNLITGNLTNNSGFLILSNNSSVGSANIVYNGGFIVAAANSYITNTLYIPGTSAIDLCLMATNSGSATWAGNVIVSGSAQWRPGSDGGSLIFLGSAPMASHIFLIPRGSLTFASNAVASSTVSGYFGRDGSGNKRSLTLTVRDNAAISMAGCSFGGGKVGGSVTVTLQNNASISFGANNVDLHNIANASAISSVRLNGGTFTAGSFTKSNASDTNLIAFNGGTLQAGGNSSAFLPAFNVTTNVVQSGGAIINDGGFAITIAATLLHDPSLGGAADGGLTKQGAGTLTLTSGLNSYNGPTTVAGGTLALTGSGAIANSTNIYVAAGATFDPSAVGPLNVANGKKLWGSGALNGNFSINSGATLAPGSNSVGTLTFTNSLTLTAGCTNIFGVSHLPLGCDSVTVQGALTNGGTLIITNLGATQLAGGDTFKLFNAVSVTGTFFSVQLPALPFGLIWDASALYTTGTIAVVRATTPYIGMLSVSGSNVGLSGTGGVGNAYYVLLGATNLTLPSSNWTRLLTNQFDNSGNFNFSTNADTAEPQTFYQIQLQ